MEDDEALARQLQQQESGSVFPVLPVTMPRPVSSMCVCVCARVYKMEFWRRPCFGTWTPISGDSYSDCKSTSRW